MQIRYILLSTSFVSITLLAGFLGGYIHNSVLFTAQKNYNQEELKNNFDQKNHKNTSGEIHAPSSLLDLENSVSGIVKQIAPSVVSIIVKKDLPVFRSDPWGFFQQESRSVRRQVGGGSGFFIRKDGMILTNKHVVADPNAEYSVVLSDGTEYSAQVLSFDPVNDLALIKIQDENKQFPVLQVVQDAQNIAIGSFVIAVGNALAEFQNSVSFGIISGKNRNIEAQGTLLTNLLQTDAAINPGNSGGPLINLQGEIIGINTAIAGGSTGIGFAIALSERRVQYMIESTENYGAIRRPFIGINYIQNTPEVALELGLLVDYGAYIIDEKESIVEGSGAQKAGLLPGDIIVSINQKDLKHIRDLANIIQNSLPGDILELTIIRKDGARENIYLELGAY